MENSRKSIARPLSVTFLSIFLVVAGLLGYWAFFGSKGAAVEPATEPAATVAPVLTATQEELVESTAAPSATPIPPTPEQPAATPAEALGEPMTLLVLGIGTRSAENEADAIYVVAMDPTSGAVDVTTFAPSMLVTAEGDQNRLEWIWRDVFYSPAGDDDRAASAVAEALDLNYGIVVDHYAVLREDSLAGVVDAIGGLDVDVPAAYADIAAGAHHFDGETAWKYVAWIPDTTGVPTDLARIERHQHVLDALQEKLTTPATLLKLPALMKQLLTDAAVVTDLPNADVLDLLGLLKTISADQITVTVVPANV